MLSGRSAGRLETISSVALPTRYRYLRSAKLGDDLVVVSTVEKVRAASVAIHQRVMRGAEHLTDARVTAAFLTVDGRPKRQPVEWVERFRAIAAKGE